MLDVDPVLLEVVVADMVGLLEGLNVGVPEQEEKAA